ncbi:MAG: hypothetical protein BJ554DRAFT_3045 [Olpidium bornovanus]|uniref:Uncharacterized protein n=1 Tax=Olpidium bornovanus TaxID=278681 RepID=A0A8H7ZPM7_9FUNG|nr:MAG: hypothetical protein BJ554DRAFT_3045 [Olpidium bornovanus]
MSIQNLLNPIEEAEATHMELTDEEILAMVQEGENQEEDNVEEEQVTTITKAEKLQSLGVAASLLDLSKGGHRNAHKVLRNVQFELRHKSVTQHTLASCIQKCQHLSRPRRIVKWFPSGRFAVSVERIDSHAPHTPQSHTTHEASPARPRKAAAAAARKRGPVGAARFGTPGPARVWFVVVGSVKKTTTNDDEKNKNEKLGKSVRLTPIARMVTGTPRVRQTKRKKTMHAPPPPALQGAADERLAFGCGCVRGSDGAERGGGSARAHALGRESPGADANAAGDTKPERAKTPTGRPLREASGGFLLPPARGESTPGSGDRNPVKPLPAPERTLPRESCGTAAAEQEKENLADVNVAAPAGRAPDTSFSRASSATNAGDAAPEATTDCEADASQLDLPFYGTNDSFDSLFAAKVASRQRFEEQLHEQKAELIEFRQGESRLWGSAGLAGGGVESELLTGSAEPGASAENATRPAGYSSPGVAPALTAASTSAVSPSRAHVREYGTRSDDDNDVEGSNLPASEFEVEEEFEQRSTRNSRGSSFSDGGNWAKNDDQLSPANGGARNDAEDDGKSAETSTDRPGSPGRSSDDKEDSYGLVEVDIDDSADRAVIEYQMRRMRMSGNMGTDEVSTEADHWEAESPVRQTRFLPNWNNMEAP